MIKDLEAVIGYRFRNISLLQNALTHSSYANERWHNSLLSNERLEFLGDSVLGMLVAEYLYRNFPNRPEGELTRMRADMVCETTLAGAANRIGQGADGSQGRCGWRVLPTASALGTICSLATVRSRAADGAGTPFWRTPWSR